MEMDYNKRIIAAYPAEIANILYFFRTPRSMSQWQDWLWKRMPKLKAVTASVPAHTPRIGRWGSAQVPDRSVLHTDLLTILVSDGQIVRERTSRTTIYQVKPLDNAAKASYKEELPY